MHIVRAVSGSFQHFKSEMTYFVDILGTVIQNNLLGDVLNAL